MVIYNYSVLYTFAKIERRLKVMLHNTTNTTIISTLVYYYKRHPHMVTCPLSLFILDQHPNLQTGKQRQFHKPTVTVSQKVWNIRSMSSK